MTGLYDMRARQWSPELGVFLQGDEFALLRTDSTLWGWPGQNPYRYSDPTGRDGVAWVPDAVQSWIIRNGEMFGPTAMRAAEATAAATGQGELVPIFEMGARAALVIDTILAVDAKLQDALRMAELQAELNLTNDVQMRGERNWERGRGDDPYWDLPLEELKRIERDRSRTADERKRAQRIRKQREKRGERCQ